jgi:hypothetical protein
LRKNNQENVKNEVYGTDFKKIKIFIKLNEMDATTFIPPENYI